MPTPAASRMKGRLSDWRLYAVLAAALLIGIVVSTSGMTRYLSLAELGDKHTLLKGFASAHPIESLLIFVGVYLAAILMFLPTMSIMLLAAGFLFGAPVAAPVAIIVGVGGATVMFLAARSTLGDVLRRRAKTGGLVQAMEAGVRRHAFTYLLTLRLVPVFPFGLVNVLAGSVGISLRTFCAATLLGLIPPALVYTSLGAGLGAVFDHGGRPSLHSLGRPEIVGPLLALAALSLAPHLYRAWRARRDAARGRDTKGQAALPKPLG